MNQIRIKDTAYLVSRRSSEQKAGDKPSVIFCSGNRKLSERAKGTVPDKASDSSAYGCSKPFPNLVETGTPPKPPLGPFPARFPINMSPSSP